MSKFYVHPQGSDSRTVAQAQDPNTPWKTPQFAYRNAAAVDGDTIKLLGATWPAGQGCIDSRGTPNGTNQSKRITFDLADKPIIEVPHGQGIRDSGGSFAWLFINPKQVELRGPLTVRDTGPFPADAAAENVGAAEHTSAIAFIKRSGAAGPQSGHNPLVDGVKVEHWMGNGIYFEKVDGAHARNCEVTGTATGIRANGGNGARVTTTLAVAAAKGDPLVTVASDAGISIGDLLRIDSGAKVETRIVVGVQDRAVLLGGYAYPGGPLLAKFPLEFAHAAGAAAVTQFGAEGNNLHHNNENTRGLGTPANGDVGGEASALAKGAYNAAMWGNHIWRNYDDRLGSKDYTIDGTAMDPYGMKAASHNVFAWNNSHDNHAWIESGTDQTQLNAGNTNGGLLVYRNYIWGEIDQMHRSPINPTASPTAPLMLLRASPDWVVRHNTCFITNGPQVGKGSNRGGLRFRSGGQYGGARSGMTITDNLFVYAVDSRLYDYTAADNLPTGAEHTLDYNLLFRPNGGTDPGAVKGANSYELNSFGLAFWRTATGWSAHDIWGADPKLADPAGGDLRLLPGSPAIGAASDGTDIGAAVSVGSSCEEERDEALAALTAMTAERDALLASNAVLTQQRDAALANVARLSGIIVRAETVLAEA